MPRIMQLCIIPFKKLRGYPEGLVSVLQIVCGGTASVATILPHICNERSRFSLSSMTAA